VKVLLDENFPLPLYRRLRIGKLKAHAADERGGIVPGVQRAAGLAESPRGARGVNRVRAQRVKARDAPLPGLEWPRTRRL
jgi:hypothetical protein